MNAYTRKVRTSSGKTGVQVVFGEHYGVKDLVHIGSADNAAELAVLQDKALQVMLGGQLTLDFDDVDVLTTKFGGTEATPLPIVGERAGYLLDCIDTCYQNLGFDTVSDGNRVFRDLVRARIIHPGSKYDSIETLAEVGIKSASYSTIKRYLPKFATPEFRDAISQCCARYAGIGPGAFILYDVTTLYFETDIPDELRKSGYSKERRLEPQILVGLLTDAHGFPLSVGAFEGNKAETHTLLPMIRKLQGAYNIDSVTIVADAGMFSAANKRAIITSGLNYILSTKITQLPDVIAEWKVTQNTKEENQNTEATQNDENEEERKDQPQAVSYPDNHIWSQLTYSDGRQRTPDTVTHFHYSKSRAQRTLKGIEEQLEKARRVVQGVSSLKRNRYVNLKTPTKTVNEALAEKHRELAGIKGYETTLLDLPADQVLTYYRRLINIERSFRMSKTDLKARPIYARKEESINAHLTIVMAALAIGHLLEHHSGQSLKRIVRTLKQYRNIEIQLGNRTIHATTPLPPDLETIVNRITQPPLPH